LENPSDEEDEKNDDNKRRKQSDRKSQKAVFLRGLMNNLTPSKNISRLEMDEPTRRTAANIDRSGDSVAPFEVQYDAIYAGTRTAEAVSFGSNMKNAVNKHTPLSQSGRPQDISSVPNSQSNGSSAMRAMQLGRNHSPSPVQSGRGRGGPGRYQIGGANEH
jgi:hypothetical protein